MSSPPVPIRVRLKFVWGRSPYRLALLTCCALLCSRSVWAQPYTVSWDANTDPFTVGYRVFGGTQSGDYPWSIDVGSATSAPLPPLPAGSAYYFVVRAYNAAGDLGPASNEASVDVGPPGMPLGMSATLVGSRVTLFWSAPAEGAAVSQYLVSVGTAAGAADVVRDAGVGAQLSASGDLAPGRYFARVRAANRNGAGPFSSEISFIVGGPDRPGNPSGLSVTWQSTVATFRWNPVTGAAHYLIEVGSAAGMSNLGTFSIGAATQYSVDVPPGTYYVRVRAANGAGVSGPSNEIIVRGVGAPSRPTGLGATHTATAITLRWSPPTAGPAPTGYLLEAGSAPDLADLAVVNLGAVTTFATTAPPGTYYVRVRAVNARGSSPASNEIVVRR